MGDENRTAADRSCTPKNLAVKIADQKLVVLWGDNHQSEFPMSMLRKRCPCATCRTERESASANPLQVLKSDPADLRVINARLVGNYAIQLYWSDGHDTGIFDFRLLRSLDSDGK